MSAIDYEERYPRFQKLKKKNKKNELSKRSFKNGKAVFRECTGKARYRDKAEAKASLQRISLDPRPDKPFRAYYCIFCNGYHVTSQE